MKKLLFVSFIIMMMMSGVAFAQTSTNTGPNSGVQNTGNNNTITNTNTTTGGTGVGSGGVVNAYGGKATIENGAVDVDNTNVGINKNKNININKPTFNNQDTNVNINRPININKNTIEEGAVKNYNSNKQNQKQGQSQGQGQGQDQGQSQSSTFTPTNVQGQNNDQVVAPEQTVIIKSPTQLPNLPSQSVPELNFGNGRMIDATSTLPNFAIYGIKKLGSKMIVVVLRVNANVKFKNLYQGVLDDAAKIANGGRKTLIDVRYQIIRAEAQKSWTTGGNLGGAGSGLASSGLGGGSGAGSIVPQWGGTKADDLFTIIFVKVSN